MATKNEQSKTDTLDPSMLSADAKHATYEKNADPNPDNLDPAPGPSTIQTPGLPKGEA